MTALLLSLLLLLGPTLASNSTSGSDEIDTTPRSLWIDDIMAMIVMLSSLFCILTAITVFRKRQVSYVKAKQPEILITQQIAAVFWMVSTLISNGHFYRKEGSLLGNCSLWDVWMKMLLGLGIWLNCLVIRMWRLYKNFIKMDVKSYNRNKLKGRQGVKRNVSMSPCSVHGMKEFYGPLIVLCSPWLAICAIVSLANAVELSLEKLQCKYHSFVYSTGITLVATIPFFLFFFFVYKLRNIRDEFNEYKDTKDAFVIAIGVFLLGFVLQGLKWLGMQNDEMRVFTRCVLTLSVVMVVLLVFHRTVWDRLWASLVNHENFETSYRKSLAVGSMASATPASDVEDGAATTTQVNPVFKGGMQQMDVEDADREELSEPQRKWRLSTGLFCWSIALILASSFQFLKRGVSGFIRLSDVMDLLSPWLLMIAFSWLFYSYDPFNNRYPFPIWIWFAIGSALMIDGHGIHMVANMLKRPVKELMKEDPATFNSSVVFKEEFDLCDLWDNKLGHYIYGLGIVVLMFLLLFVHRSRVFKEPMGTTNTVWTVVASVLGGLAFFGAGITFDKTVLVSTIFSFLLLAAFGYWFHKKGMLTSPKDLWISLKKRPVYLYYALGQGIALLADILWVCIVGGFRDRKDVFDM